MCLGFWLLLTSALLAPNSHKPRPILERSADIPTSSRTGHKENLVKANIHLLEAYRHIGAHCRALGLDHRSGDIAKVIYSKIYDAAAAPDRPTLAITAACVYMAVRTLNEPRTLDHIFHYAVQDGVSRVDCGGTLCQLSQFLALNYDLDTL